ncbi:YraN family protein [Aidingimonas lacisalsi]|uniref:YraN family protein n=1 Tax=Aidingimonas lacisalsi TaxID=2604086 RepID=UPI0011D2A21A|nr:YraN family protein [Aidingimonas lacisalsi]
MMKSHDARARGMAIERQVATWLQTQGLVPVASNHHVKGGELDLVMHDDDTLVFIEVKHRRDTRYGHPSEMVTPLKQRRLIRAAHLYLASNGLSSPCRFDIVAVTGTQPSLTFEWIKAAFDAF